MNANVVAHIRRSRQERNWTQEELASRAKLSVSTVAKIESGKQNGSRRALRAIASALDFRIGDDGQLIVDASDLNRAGELALGVFADVVQDVQSLAATMRYPADMLASIALKWFCHQPRDVQRRILAEAAPLMIPAGEGQL
jgi:transcriptional regulator with XRE-family HTH domain